MHILYIHQYFNTPSEPGGTRSYWISKELIERGHKVTMITSTNKFHAEPKTEFIDGINVVYVKNSYSNYMSKARKVFSFVNFVRLAINAAKKVKDVDIIYATSTPLTIGYIALRLKKVMGWKYIFEVRDLWPEFPIQVGAIKNSFLIKKLKSLEKKIYDNSEFIVALSPGMKEGVLNAGIPDDKCCVIPNMSKPDSFYPREKSQSIVEKYQLDLTKFNVVHFGSMGVANGLEYIIETAKCLTQMGNKDINFIFLGDGATLPRLKEMAANYKLSNVQFLGNFPMNLVSEIVNCCNASVTCFKNLDILKTNSPNKLFDSLSAGIPIIVNSSGWTKDLVEKEKCGFFVDPENPKDFAEKLVLYKDNKAFLEDCSKNSRRLSLTVFDKSILCKKVAEVIETSV